MSKPEKDDRTLERVQRQFENTRQRIREIEERARQKNPPEGGPPPDDETPGGEGAPAAPNH